MSILSAATVAARGGQTSEAPADKPVDLEAIDKAMFLAELKRRWAEGEMDTGDVPFIVEEIETAELDDPEALSQACDWWKRGDPREALHYLEYALGRDFSGLGDLRPEQLR